MAEKEDHVMELPASWANFVSIVGFIFLAALVWSIPKGLIYKEAPDSAAWRDIRLWATSLIIFQIMLYLVFS